MTELLIAEEHDQIYQVWCDRQLRDMAIVHVDFHCDMRGLLVDRARSTAYMASRYESTFVDDGNFLSHAIMDGVVSSVRWVHDQHGGRRHDKGCCVNYESDVIAPLHGLLHRVRGGRKVPLTFEEVLFSDWEGLRPGEYLDIDWDALASAEYQPSHIQELIDQFLSLPVPVVPKAVFLARSPDYSYGDREMFEVFVVKLAEKFSASIVRLPEPTTRPADWRPQRSLPWRVVGSIRRRSPKRLVELGYRVLDRLHTYDTRHDIAK